MSEEKDLSEYLLPPSEQKNLEDYFSSSIVEDVPPALPDEYQEVQQEVHQTWWARGGAVYGMLGIGGAAVCGVLFLMTGGGDHKPEQVVAQAAPAPAANPDAKLKSKLWFKEQNESDGKFMKKGKVPISGKTASKRPTVVPQSIPSQPIALAPSRVPVSDGPPKAEFNPPPYSAPSSPVAYQPPVQRQAIDPNAEWQRIQQNSTFNVPGVESQQPQQVAYNPPSDPQTQNVAWNQPTEQMAMSSTLGKQIAANTELSATLQVKVPSGGSQKVLLKLNSPLKSNGEVVLPKGTLLVASAQPEDDGMSFQITGAYLSDDRLISLPSESITASASIRRGGAGKAVRNFLIGAAGGVADQMLSGDITSSISNGTNTTVINNAKKSLMNSALGGVRGGISTLTSDLQNNSGNETTGLKKGAKVKIVFTAPAVI